MRPTKTEQVGRSQKAGPFLTWLCLLVPVLGMAPGRAQAAQPFLAPQSTLVLFVGLAGDSESENTFQDQLQTWLGLLGSPAPPRKIVVLNDNPQTLHLPAGLPAQTLHNDRASFLSLTQQLAGVSAPVVVIAWGHGGRQGAIPVLHVHGPRLTPADFAAVAASLPQSTWLLFFRGSGAFARQLAAEGRQILSSECDTMFNSDPIGMSVLLKSLRKNPAVSFPDLARSLGGGTAGWYAQRNLARTEEPTLWLDQQKPQFLAEAVSEQGDSSQDSGPANAAANTIQSGGATNVSAKRLESDPTSTTELPPLWKQVKPVAPQQFPEADAVLLRNRISCALGSSPALRIEHDQFIQILTAEGKKFGDFDLSYSPPAEEVDFLDCEVLRPDGKLIRLDPDAVGERQEVPVGDYAVSQRKFFSLPGVEPGAILHVRYRTQWKEFPLPQISMALPLEPELPVIASTIQVSLPKQTPFHFAFENLSPPDPLVQQSAYTTSYTWQFDHQPAQPHEVLASPQHGARLLFSTFSDWAAFAQWYERITRLTAEVSPEIAAKAKELTQRTAADRDKVQALYNYVTGLRYVAVPLGINSLRPHAAANVLHNQYGDCKDKANLLNALLRALNIQADLVLVPRFGQAQEAVPGLAFNHAISRVKLADQTLWLDSTDDICRFGLLPPGDPGRQVLVVDGQVRALTELPLPEPQENQFQLTGEIDTTSAKLAWPVTLKVSAHGFPDYQLRQAVRETKAERGAVPLLAVSWRPANGAFALEKQTMSPVSGLTEDFSWQAQGTWIGLASGTAPKQSVRPPFWIPQEWDLALHHRHSPLFLNQGYPLQLEQEIHLHLPTDAPTPVLPAPCGSESPPLRWRIEWARVAHDKLVARFQAQLQRGELSSAESTSFQQQLRALLQALAAEVSLSP